MTKIAGIKPLKRLDDQLLGELKQNLLLFDKVGIPVLDPALEAFKKKHKNCQHTYLIDELEFLKEDGYLGHCETEVLFLEWFHGFLKPTNSSV